MMVKVGKTDLRFERRELSTLPSYGNCVI